MEETLVNFRRVVNQSLKRIMILTSKCVPSNGKFTESIEDICDTARFVSNYALLSMIDCIHKLQTEQNYQRRLVNEHESSKPETSHD